MVRWRSKEVVEVGWKLIISGTCNILGHAHNTMLAVEYHCSIRSRPAAANTRFHFHRHCKENTAITIY